MRRRLVVLSICTALVAPGAALAATGPWPVADFVDSIGVNIHMAYTDTSYADVGRVKQALAFTGIRHVRNLLQSRPGNPTGQAYLDQLAATKICGFDFVSIEPDLALAQTWLTRFATRFPGSIDAVEGPNEVDHWPITYKGGSGRNAAVDYQKDLYRTVHATPALSGVAVYGLTGLGSSWYGDLSDSMDYANEHPYARNGVPPAYHLLKEIAQANQRVAPSRPMVVTESGYPTLLNRPGISFGKDGVSPDVQARYLLDLLFDFNKSGVARTYLYELMDEKPDPDGRTIENHFGLFDVNKAPKPAAIALHNLTTILDEGGASFTGSAKTIDIDGLPESGTSLMLTKADGSSTIVVWAEPPIWDGASGTAIPVAGADVTVHFDNPARSVKVYDPLVGIAPVSQADHVGQATITVTDHPILVHIEPDRP